MEELKGVFIGYKTFVSQKNNRNYFVISLLFMTFDEEHQRVDYFIKDIFTSEETYYDFVKNHSLLQHVDVKREIVGDNVRYYI